MDVTWCTIVAKPFINCPGGEISACSSSGGRGRVTKMEDPLYPRWEHCFFAKMKKTEREREEEESLETAWAIVAGTGYAFWMRFIISIICYLFKNDNAMGLGRRAWWMKGGTRGNLSVSPMTGSVVSFIFTLLYPCNLFEIFIFKIIPRCLTAFAKLRVSFPPLLTTLF